MLYTSSFKKSNLNDETKIFIAITRVLKIAHKRLNHLVDLSPPYDLLMGLKTNLISFESFSKSYYNQINKDLVKKLLLKVELAEKYGKDVVLLCYEDTEKECHRGILSKYIFDEFRIVVNEI